MNEVLTWTPRAVICKYSPEQVSWVRATTGLEYPEGGAMSVFCRPYEYIEVAGNVLTTAGLSRLMAALVGGPALTHSVTRLGVGNDTSHARPTDRRLGSRQYFREMDQTYPELAGRSVLFRATFGEDEANFEWGCWGLDVSPAAGTTSGSVESVLLNRKACSGIGSKPRGEIWTLTCEVTLALLEEGINVLSNEQGLLDANR